MPKNSIIVNGLSPSARRPYLYKDGIYIDVYTGGDPLSKKSYKPQLIQANASMVKPIQANATLRRDEWKTLDDMLLRISETRLNGVQDLIDNNLTYNLGNGGMGSTVLETHDVGDALEAVVTMDGITRGQNDAANFETNYLPLPIIHADYEINARVLAASRNMGNALDTTLAERAARKVAAKLESLLFGSGTAYKFQGGYIYSYLNHPSRNTVTLSQNWDASGKTGVEIKDDVLAMKQASIDAYHYGPWMLYIPTAYETVLDDDFDTTTPGTSIRERLLKISGIKGIKVVDTLPANNVLLVEMNTDTVRLVRGMGLTNLQWSQEAGMVTKYKVMTIQVPQVRADQDGNSGIVHLAA